jgi:type IV pilus assembly protein PilQ
MEARVMGKLQSRRGPFGWARLGAPGLVTVLLVLGCASGAGTGADGEAGEPAPAAAAQSRPAPTEITSLEMREAAPGVRLELRATGPLVWTQYRDTVGRLVLELPNSSPAPAVVDLPALGGVVESVAVSKVDSGDRPLTRLVITTRGETEHELTAEGNSMQLSVVPAGIAGAVAAAEPPAPEPMAPAPVAPAAPLPAPQLPYPSEPARAAAPPAPPAGTPDVPYVAPTPAGVVATRLEAVVVEPAPGGAEVRIAGDGDFAYSTFQLSDPPRFVIDLHGVVNAAPRSAVPGEGPVLQRVRLAQFKSQPQPVARVVLDLTEDVVPYLVPTGDGLVVRFDGAMTAAMPGAEASTEPVLTEVSEPAPPAPPAAMPPSATEAIPSIEITGGEVTGEPALAQAPAPAFDEPSDVGLLEAVQVQDVPSEPQSAEPVPPTFESRELGEGERQYVGAPINFSLRDADLKEVLRTFAKISGLNMVVQPGVGGQVTVELTGVPWDQALEIILKTNNLGYELEGNIMRIAPLALLNQEAQAEAERRQAAALAVPLRTVLKRVSYASASEVAGLLRSGSASILSQRGSVVVDPRTNTLIIKELPDFMDTVLAIIDQVDVPEPQVMIEARIVETTKRFNRTLGISWSFDAVANAASGNTTGLVFPNQGSAEGGVNLLTGGQNAFLNLSLGNVLNTFNIDLALQAAESEGLINILSAPKVATLNNVSASIQSGLQIPVQTVANNTVTVQFVNATLRLDVTPHVTADGTVLMDISVQKREPQLAFAVVGATNAPIATREAQTRVIVRDGGTAVIGGIYEVTNDRGEDRVPGLADIPILGHLFKNRRSNNENEELLIFITPRVIKL